jgi:tmRNA-binding protein
MRRIIPGKVISKYTAGLILKGPQVQEIKRGRVDANKLNIMAIGGCLYISSNNPIFKMVKILLKKKEVNKLISELYDPNLFIRIVGNIHRVNGWLKVKLQAESKAMYDKRRAKELKRIKRDIEY